MESDGESDEDWRHLKPVEVVKQSTEDSFPELFDELVDEGESWNEGASSPEPTSKTPCESIPDDSTAPTASSTIVSCKQSLQTSLRETKLDELRESLASHLSENSNGVETLKTFKAILDTLIQEHEKPKRDSTKAQTTSRRMSSSKSGRSNSRSKRSSRNEGSRSRSSDVKREGRRHLERSSSRREFALESKPIENYSRPTRGLTRSASQRSISRSKSNRDQVEETRRRSSRSRSSSKKRSERSNLHRRSSARCLRRSNSSENRDSTTETAQSFDSPSPTRRGLSRSQSYSVNNKSPTDMSPSCHPASPTKRSTGTDKLSRESPRASPRRPPRRASSHSASSLTPVEIVSSKKGLNYVVDGDYPFAVSPAKRSFPKIDSIIADPLPLSCHSAASSIDEKSAYSLKSADESYRAPETPVSGGGRRRRSMDMGSADRPIVTLDCKPSPKITTPLVPEHAFSSPDSKSKDLFCPPPESPMGPFEEFGASCQMLDPLNWDADNSQELLQIEDSESSETFPTLPDSLAS